METHKNENALEAEPPVREPNALERAESDDRALHDRAEDLKETRPGSEGAAKAPAPNRGRAVKTKARNNLKRLRLEKMMSKAELARRAAVSTLTIDRVERGMSCRMDTKRKILEALGLKPSDRVTVFGEEE